MSKDCTHNELLLLRNGTAQNQRYIDALSPESVKLFDLSTRDWMQFAFRFSKMLNYFETATNTATGNWGNFFVKEDEIDVFVEKLQALETEGTVNAKFESDVDLHLTLFAAFLKLTSFSQKRLNKLSKKHLDFYYKEILKLQNKAPKEDKAFMLFELAKNAAHTRIPAGTKMDGGKDSLGNKLPYLEAIAISFLTDKQSEFLQFIQGNLDFMKSLDASYKDDILNTDGTLKAKYVDKINMQTGAYLNTEYLGIYLDGAENYPTKSKLIRQAINYGFDRTKMIRFLRNNIGTPATSGFIPKGLPSFNNQKGYSYQPEKAAALVAKYVQETGNKNLEITITTNGNYLDLCEFIQRELQNIGLQTKVDVIPPSTLRQGKSSGKLPIFRASWIADYPDAENYVSLFYSKNFTPNGPNYTHFKNEEFDELYENSIKEVNVKKRYKLYQQMDSIIIDEAPIVPLYYDEVIRFSQKNIQGLGINPIDLLNLKRVKKN